MPANRLFSVLTVCLLLTPHAFGKNNQVADLGQVGPYAVGFTFFLAEDDSRPTEILGQIGGRPIPVYMFYPVDSADIDGLTPEALYPLDPYGAFLPFPPVGSSNFEVYGLDRAYNEPEPSPEGPFPLLMFSPGLGTAAAGHISIGTRLASHGFAVAIVQHFGEGIYPGEPASELNGAIFDRPLDVSFALDQVLDNNLSLENLLFDAVNPDQIAAAGWSVGGYTAMTLASGDDLVCFPTTNPPPHTCVAALPDPRVKAIVALDGSNQLLRFDELARITIPTLLMGQEPQDNPAGAAFSARAHAAIQARPSYRVDLNNARHWSFWDVCESFPVLGDLGLYPPELVSAILAECAAFIPSLTAHELVNKYMMAFLKTELVGETGYQPILTPEHASQEPDIEFFVTEPYANSPDTFRYFVNQPDSEEVTGNNQAIGYKDCPSHPFGWYAGDCSEVPDEN